MGTSCRLTAGTYLGASEMAIELYTDQPIAARAFLAGLTNSKPPFGYTRNSFEVRQAGTYAFDVPTVPKLDQITAALDMQRNDPDHIEIYNRGKCQSDNFQDLWVYLERNLADPTQDVIAIPNAVDNPEGGYSVMSMAAPPKSTDEKYTWDFSLTTAITSIFSFIHLFDTTPDFTFAAPGGGDTLARTTGSWVNDGIVEGMKLYVDDQYVVTASSNFGKIFTVATGGLSALTLTFVEDGYATAGAGVATNVYRFGYQM